MYLNENANLMKNSDQMRSEYNIINQSVNDYSRRKRFLSPQLKPKQ